MSRIKGTTKLLGVIGHPIAHTLSPAMHNAAIEYLGLDYIYLPFPIAPAQLAIALDGFAAMGVVGLSVTIPHKQAVIPHLAKISDLAQAVGAVNTLRWTEAGWEGTNTDVAGFISPLQAMQRDWSREVAVVLGNGGAARAVVAGCHQLGFREIWVVGRNRTNLEEFQASWTSVNCQTYLWEELPSLINQASLLVNTTPIGMHPQTGDSPVSGELMDRLPSQAIIYDLIYTPHPTELLKLATARGATTIDGIEMLVQQGSVAFEWWLDRQAPVAIMRQALLNWLETKD
jgi:shikimate dehydrogenase